MRLGQREKKIQGKGWVTLVFSFYLSKMSLHLIGAKFLVPEAYVVLDFEFINIKDLQNSLAQSPFFLLNLHQGKYYTPFTLEEEILCSFPPITKGLFPSFNYTFSPHFPPT